LTGRIEFDALRKSDPLSDPPDAARDVLRDDAPRDVDFRDVLRPLCPFERARVVELESSRDDDELLLRIVILRLVRISGSGLEITREWLRSG
jgi:hypothetical protein